MINLVLVSIIFVLFYVANSSMFSKKLKTVLEFLLNLIGSLFLTSQVGLEVGVLYTIGALLLYFFLEFDFYARLNILASYFVIGAFTGVNGVTYLFLFFIFWKVLILGISKRRGLEIQKNIRFSLVITLLFIFLFTLLYGDTIQNGLLPNMMVAIITIFSLGYLGHSLRIDKDSSDNMQLFNFFELVVYPILCLGFFQGLLNSIFLTLSYEFLILIVLAVLFSNYIVFLKMGSSFKSSSVLHLSQANIFLFSVLYESELSLITISLFIINGLLFWAIKMGKFKKISSYLLSGLPFSPLFFFKGKIIIELNLVREPGYLIPMFILLMFPIVFFFRFESREECIG